MKPRVWVLLQELAVRTPLAHVARLLNLYEFTGMLRKTLQWLHEPVRWTEVLIDMVDGDGDTSSLLDDSSDTVKSSSAIPSTSKKRKLDGTEIDGSREVPSTAAGSFQVLVCAICGLVTQLESLTTVSEKTHGFAVEHMKRSLRISPDDAACVMGSSFYLINRIIQTPQSYWHQRRVFTRELQNQLANTGYKSCILPVIDLWNRRSLTARNSPGKSSNVCYCEIFSIDIC